MTRMRKSRSLPALPLRNNRVSETTVQPTGKTRLENAELATKILANIGGFLVPFAVGYLSYSIAQSTL
jgi:hypothetical protein